LDNVGIHIPAVDPLPGRTLESEKLLHDVISHGPKGGLSRGRGGNEDGASLGTQPLETFFEAFLQSFNHFLFLFSEFELRQNFNPREWASDTELPVDIYLVLALGAKASGFQVQDLQNDWYGRARLRLLSEDCQDDLWKMRVLTLICIFEIDDDIDVSYRFLSMKSS
jgi:hypothetical protein